jgi:hypothetical protein
MRSTLLGLGFVLATQAAHGHHSTAGIFDPDRIVEIEGTVTAVGWRNPHAALTIAAKAPDGTGTEWIVEMASLNFLRLRGLTPDMVAIGYRIRAAGLSSSRGRQEIFARNLLLPNGQEMLLQPNVAARWPEGKNGRVITAVVDAGARQQALRTAEGIFRVWSTPLDDPRAWQMFTGGYALTPAASAKLAQWNPLDYESRICAPKSVPRVLNTPLPVEFVHRGGDIVLRIEEGDVERVIHMTPDGADGSSAPSVLGRSIGRWDGNTLVVTTTGLADGYLDGDGTPQSRGMEVTERFTMSASGDRLDYAVTAIDSAMFATPVTATRYWTFEPGVQLQRFDCNDPNRAR